MGVISAWRDMLSRPKPGLPLASPWSTSTLQTAVLADIFGKENLPVTREMCMSIPAVSKARALVAGKLARQPLKAYRGDAELPARSQPSWLYRTNGDVPPQMRMLWTIDDLFFGGWSLWGVERGTARDDQRYGPILDAYRVPYEWWEFDPDGKILVNGGEVTEDSVILFAGPFEGLIEAAADTIRGARNLERAWAKRVNNPIPATELHQTTDDVMEDEEIDELVDTWIGMLNKGGGVAYTPPSIDVRTHGETVLDLFIEGRNAVTLDVGRHTNVGAQMLDASMATSSLQYVTAVDGRNSFIDDTLDYWAMPIEARLSMDDVVPRGQRIAFDLSHLTRLPQPSTGPATED
ncbi:phage portal protein [Jiangella gansuensis]|uniref:phage portal protein n=1 Tax=Jiangella gansuensis TaxID=281473 RepID=UPI0004ADD6FB|nr:phage portal protein [Jiangella gansuensis]